MARYHVLLVMSGDDVYLRNFRSLPAAVRYCGENPLVVGDDVVVPPDARKAEEWQSVGDSPLFYRILLTEDGEVDAAWEVGDVEAEDPVVRATPKQTYPGA